MASRITCTLFASLAVAACTLPEGNMAHEFARADKEPVLLVAAGGWFSCKNGGPNEQFITAQFENLAADMREAFPQKAFHTLTSCSKIRSPVRRNHVLFNRPGTFATSLDGASCPDVTHQNWHNVIAEHARALGIRKGYGSIFLFGHSYGGWQQMDVAARIPQDLDVAGMFSLEPVSPRTCSVRDFIGNKPPRLAERRAREGRFTLRSPTEPRRGIVPGCRRAPSDTDNLAIAKRMGERWWNLHLDEQQWREHMYSGPADHAANISVRTATKELVHHEFGFNSTVWAHVCCRVARRLDDAMALDGVCHSVTVDGKDGKPVSTERNTVDCGDFL